MIAPDIVFLDAETLPTIDPDLIAEIEAEVTPPGNITKPESIAAWHETKGAEARKEAVRRTSLDGGTGRLGALSWAWSDQPVVSAHTAVDGAFSIDRERELLTGFFAELSAFEKEMGCAPTLVGHNISGFDIRWIWKRAIVIGIQPPFWWPVNAKPWDQDAIQDTMIMWEGPKGRISQDRLARTLGLRGKGAVDGSMVADMWDAGEHEEIRTYCADDVTTVRRIWCRIVGEDAPMDEEELVAFAREQLAARPEEHPLFCGEPEPVDVTVPVKKGVVVREGRVIPGFLMDDVKEKEAA